jgi:hypothetical protein
MTVNERILSCLREVTGISPRQDINWSDSLSSLGMDSLEILDFMYTLENEFNITKLSSGRLITVNKVTLNDIRNQLLTHDTSIAII